MTRNKQRLSRALILPAVAVILLGIITTSLFFYKNTLQKDLDAASCETLNQIMEQQRFTFASKLQDQQSTIKTYADSLSDSEDMSSSVLLEKLQMIEKNSTYDFVSYVWPNGDTLENTGVHLNISDRTYFENALGGETVITNPITSKVTGEHIITFATPVMDESQIIGALVGIYDVRNLSKLLMPSFNGKGYTYIATTDGEVIVTTEATGTHTLYTNLFEGLDTVEFLDHDDNQAIRSNVAAGKSGHSRYLSDGNNRLLHYAPLGINDWYIFSIAPSAVIVPQTVKIVVKTTFFVLCIALVAILTSILFVSAQRKYTKNLKEIAFVDTLTGTANHKAFKLTASEILSKSTGKYAFIILDVDSFKVFNDTFGYDMGDRLLICISEILKKNVTKSECFGHLDSDEFYLLLSYTDSETIEARIQTMQKQINLEFKKRISSTYNLVLCAGIYVIQNPTAPISSISDKARHAQKLIKGGEDSSICFYTEDIRDKLLGEKEIENKMHAALQNEKFLLYLQPKYDLLNETVCGAEALVRWDDNGVIICPDAFIPIFERTGFITKLDMYMLEKTCHVIRSWIDVGIPPVPVSINFSRIDLKKPNFVDEIAAVADKYQIPPHLIELELTESTMIHNEQMVMEVLEHLHGHGFSLSMDDFGNGYSSLGLLKNLPIDVIKLDRNFFVDYGELRRGPAVIAGIISIAKTLGISTVAEGVETKEQIACLREMGCDIVQGFYYAKPMPAASLTALLHTAKATFLL